METRNERELDLLEGQIIVDIEVLGVDEPFDLDGVGAGAGGIRGESTEQSVEVSCRNLNTRGGTGVDEASSRAVRPCRPGRC
jgi:hypothetical protein